MPEKARGTAIENLPCPTDWRQEPFSATIAELVSGDWGEAEPFDGATRLHGIARDRLCRCS